MHVVVKRGAPTPDHTYTPDSTVLLYFMIISKYTSTYFHKEKLVKYCHSLKLNQFVRCDFLPKYTQIQLQIILFLLFWDVLWIINDLLAPLSLFFHEFQQNSQFLRTISNDPDQVIAILINLF